MKKYTYLLFIPFISLVTLAQEKKNIPVLFPVTQGKPCESRIEIPDSCIQDTIKVLSDVVVQFKHPYNDTLHTVEVESVELRCLILKSRNKYNKICRFDEKEWTEEEKRIWLALEKILIPWYMDQPYEYFTEREIHYYKRLRFTRVLFLIPEKKLMNLIEKRCN